MGCFLSSEGSSCGTMFGNCTNQSCQSSCTKEAQEAAIEIEKKVDEMMKKWLHEHLHKYLPPLILPAVENALIAAIDVDIVPRIASASAPPQLMAPTSPSPDPTPPGGSRRIRHYRNSSLSPTDAPNASSPESQNSTRHI